MKRQIMNAVRLPVRAARRAARRWSARTVSQVRRIERVHPPSGRRVVAMTFDDGPTASPARPGDGSGLTAALIEAMGRYGARGTFNIIGGTAENYPDRPGQPGTFLWSGVAYDHYPEFGHDQLAGAESQPGLVERLLAAGHELANHSYRHLGFGPMRVVYGSRASYHDSDAVQEDLERLDHLVRSRFGYTMKLARPPHYIDGTSDGRSAYDVYAALGYQYLAASFDGGGWQPGSGDYDRDVQNMVSPLEAALQRDPESLNGHIIFHKDGYNMSGQSPVVDALPRHLELLRAHGYEVMTVSELMSLSPFADVDPGGPWFAALSALERRGHRLAYRDNTCRPSSPLTWGQLAAMLLPPGEPYRGQEAAIRAVARCGRFPSMRVRPGAAVRRADLHLVLARAAGVDPVTVARPRERITRGQAAVLVTRALYGGESG